MSVAISWDNKMQLAKCDIMVGFPISSHICAISIQCSPAGFLIAIIIIIIHYNKSSYYKHRGRVSKS